MIGKQVERLDRLQVGDEELIIDDNAPPGGEEFHEEAGLAPHPDLTDALLSSDPRAKEFLSNTQPISQTPIYRGIRKPGEKRMCKNDRCANLVGPSKNVGVEKLFCSYRCSHLYHNRLFGIRNREASGFFLERDTIDSVPVRFIRPRPRDLVTAQLRYERHLEREACPLASTESSKRCPSHAFEDYYSTKRLCLIYGVLVDDLYEQTAKAKSLAYLRQWTTGDGEWKELSDLPHMGII